MKILQLLPIYGSKQRDAQPEPQPYKFERDKAIPNANETFRALLKFRCEIDNAKRDGKI